jgi:hypothetical protein
MNLRHILFLLFILLFGGCSGPTQPIPSSYLSDSEYAVLHHIVSTQYPHYADSVIFIADSTSSHVFASDMDSALSEFLGYIRQHLPDLAPTTEEDFKTKNRAPTYVAKPRSICSTSLLTGRRTFRLPFFEVSRVGFSADRRQALAYVGCVEGPLAGSGACYVLTFRGDHWIILDGVSIWES